MTPRLSALQQIENAFSGIPFPFGPIRRENHLKIPTEAEILVFPKCTGVP